MKTEEINEFIEDSFKKIIRSLHKAIDDFETEDIHQFRTEIKKLKVFLHLLSMESEGGLPYRITKKMKTVYGYLGVIQNLQLQLNKTNEYLKNSFSNIPVGYLNSLTRELEFWKKLTKNFMGTEYDFYNDKKEMTLKLPDELSEKSIRKFIHYTLYELQITAGHLDDYNLDSARKFIEDIYYNLVFIRPFITEQQSNLFDEKALEECLKLFVDFRDKCITLSLLQSSGADKLDVQEKQLLKEIEMEWLREKNKLKSQLSDKIESMHIKADNLSKFAFENSLNESV